MDQICIDSIIIALLIGMVGTILGFSIMRLGIVPWYMGIFGFIINIGYFTVPSDARV